MPFGSMQKRYLTTSATSTAFTAEMASSGVAMFSSSPPNAPVEIGTYRGAVFVPFGEGADGSTFNFRLWILDRNAASQGAKDDMWALYGYGSAALCGSVGASGLQVGASERFCDTITWTPCTASTTPIGIGGVYEDAFLLGASAAFSPGSDIPGRVVVPDIGGAYSFFFDFDLTGATAANMLYTLTE